MSKNCVTGAVKFRPFLLGFDAGLLLVAQLLKHNRMIFKEVQRFQRK